MCSTLQVLKIQIDRAEVQEEVQEICALSFFDEREEQAQRLRAMHHARSADAPTATPASPSVAR